MSTLTAPAANRPTRASLPAKAARYQSLDLWRGAACLALVVFHSAMQVMWVEGQSAEGVWGQLGSGLMSVVARTWIGVPMFFVISGYCIMATLDSRRRRGEVALGDYFRRRVRRIYPPFWIAAGLAAVAIFVTERYLSPGLFTAGVFTIPSIESLTLEQWLGNFTLVESWRPLFAGGEAVLILPNTWTLCYEEQFYAVAGLLLFAAPRRIFLAAGVFTAFAFVAKAAAHVAGVSLEGSLIDGRWLLIAVGILVYYRINFATKFETRLIYGLLACGLLVSGPRPQTLLELMPNHGIERFVACAFGLFLCVAYPADGWISRQRLLKPLAWCGQISYSVYLTHPLIAKGLGHGLSRAGFTGNWETLLVTVPLSVALSLAVATVFYRLVESRFLNPATSASRQPKPQWEPSAGQAAALSG